MSEVQKLSDGFYVLDEGMVRTFLFDGPNKGILIDTGFGNEDIFEKVKSVIGDKPVDVIITHSDGDHVNGLAAFKKDVYMHPSDFNSLKAQQKDAAYTLHPLWDEDTLSNEAFTFTVLHIPGHTPGSIALLEPEKRILIGGDSIQNGAIFMFGPNRNTKALIASLKRLLDKGITDKVDTIYASHNVLALDPSFIRKTLEGAEALDAGKLTPEEPAQSFGDATFRQYTYGDVKFLAD